MKNFSLQPLSVEEMKETNGGSFLAILAGLAIGWLVGVVVYAFATSDGKCECEEAAEAAETAE